MSSEFYGTPRDWLRSQGFPVGDRGRLSEAMKKAVESANLIFVEPIEVEAPEVDNSWRLNENFNDPIIRESRTLYGFSKEGYKIGFSMCFDCTSHMSRCKCKLGVMAPSTVVSTKEPDVRLTKPRK